MSDERVERIKKMEEKLDKVTPKINNFENALNDLNSAFEDIKSLSDYYKKEWKEDYEADEQGKIPKDLKKGVLSQDTLYDLLGKLSEMKNDLTELSNKISQLH